MPWFSPSTEIYEDWYLFENFAGIDNLERAILTDEKITTHGALMTLAADAYGAVYVLAEGLPRVESLVHALWVSRRIGSAAGEGQGIENTAYEGRKCSLWTRSLALGPSPQCLLTVDESIAHQHEGVLRTRELVWSPRESKSTFSIDRGRGDEDHGH